MREIKEDFHKRVIIISNALNRQSSRKNKTN